MKTEALFASLFSAPRLFIQITDTQKQNKMLQCFLIKEIPAESKCDF